MFQKCRIGEGRERGGTPEKDILVPRKTFVPHY